MPAPLIECIPNFSEARRPDIVQKIIAEIQSVPGIHVLDKHSDLDHNRTVVTFIGSPSAVEKAAFLGIAEAAKWIDLDEHKGAHPRIGATDVVPFVPITEVTMEDCVELARRLGKRVGEELRIPVYLYEEAATCPERQNLENIRKGQYEALKEEMGKNPERDPDFGPKKIGKAGATVIGARQPLIAFNVYLATNEVSIAQKIARFARLSNGGFKCVKAMGVLVDGRAQVSMNLTNYRQSSIARVVEFVRREAQRYGTMIHHTELVGLAPQESLIDAAVWYLQLDQFEPEQILERRLFEVQTETGAQAVVEVEPSFLDRLASATPTPGGGSASAFTAAEAAALVAMVARLTVGKKKYADVETEMWQVIEEADGLRMVFEKAEMDDADAFNAFMAAMKMPKDNEEQQKKRSITIEKATMQAIQVPSSVAESIPQLLHLAGIVASKGNVNAISDAGTAGALARAAFTGTALNVRTNAVGMENPSLAEKYLKKLLEIETMVNKEYATLQKVLSERSNLLMPG
jgi:glutamate formiminotransferase / formiminotetrahydrofolate cyclodeaminase